MPIIKKVNKRLGTTPEAAMHHCGGLRMETGDMKRGVLMEHRVALYESIKEFGDYV